jgi:hypothetical protein
MTQKATLRNKFETHVCVRPRNIAVARITFKKTAVAVERFKQLTSRHNGMSVVISGENVTAPYQL